VWIIEQYHPHSLNEHLSNGRPWDLDRNFGGLQVLPPWSNHEDSPDDEGGFAQGNADAIFRQRALIEKFAPDALLVLSADHLYTFDFNDALETHFSHSADATLVTTRVPRRDATRFGVVQSDRQKRVSGFQYKPDKPRGGETCEVMTEIIVYNPKVLLETLATLAAKNKDEDAPLKDFGDELLPALVKRKNVWSHPMRGYWRDVGTVSSYFQAHRDLLENHPDLQPDDARWPILTYDVPRLPARITKTAAVEDSLLSPGACIAGEVSNSVIGPQSVVEKGAIVRDSIVGRNVFIASGATVNAAIIDDDARIGRGAVIGKARRGPLADSQIAVIEQNARIAAKATVLAGAHLNAK
jgi:glucose-1-phosphate adenylyltransferase